MRDLAPQLKKSSLLIHGSSLEGRQAAYEALRRAWTRPGKTGVFILKSSPKKVDAVLKDMARKLPITSPLGLAGEDMSLDQVRDYWLEWPHERSFDSALVIWPEVHAFACSEPRFFAETLEHMLGYQNLFYVAGKCELRFVLTSREPLTLNVDRRSIAAEVLPSYFKAVPGRVSKTLEHLLQVIPLAKTP